MNADAQDTALERVAQSHAALRGGLAGGSDWDRRRGEALARLLERGLPDRRDENWKYLDWTEIGRRGLSPGARPASAAATPAGALPGVRPERSIRLVDGRFPAAFTPGSAGTGIEVAGLAETLARDPAYLARMLPVPGDAPDERFALLAEAFTADGVVIRIADGVVLDEPLCLVHLAAGADGFHTRVVVDVGRHSRLQLVEHFHGAGSAEALANLTCELRLAEGAAVEHLRLHQQGAGAAHVETLRATLGRDSRYRHQLFMLGGRVLRSNVHVRLEGSAAECELHGLFMVDGTRQADLYTLIEHVARQTRSEERVRGVANDRGRGAFNGRILVGAGAAGADSSQSSRNLILSPLAEIDARPQLEILTDDVKCSHGATIGSLDEQQLFYLLSRGIDPATARGLLTFAFCEEVVSRVALPQLRRHLEELVVGHLPDRDIIRDFL